MTLRIQLPRRMAFYQACTIMFFVVFLMEYILLYRHAGWAVSDTWGSFVQSAVTTPITALMRVGVYAALVLALVLRIQMLRIRVPQLLAILVMTMFGIGWTVHALFTTTMKVTVYDSATPVFWLCSITMLAGYEEEIWKLFSKALPILGLIFLALSVKELFEYQMMVGIMSVQRVTYSALLYFFIYAFWLLATSIFINDNAIRTYGALLIVATAILVIMAMIFRSRGWMLQTLTLFIYTVVRNGIRWKDKRKALLFYTVCIAFVIFVFWDMLFYLSGPLRERLFADSRSHQYDVFFQQVDKAQLITGQGINATYSFTGMSTTYRFFDNQFILEMFRYGIVPILIYTIMLIRPLWTAVVHFDWDLLRRSMVIVLWLVAMAGLSVYFNLNTNIHCAAMWVVIGRLNFLCGKKKGERS